MNVEFYFDPSCPWCWITSRWLLLVSDHRDVTITWRPFSLAMKNDELVADGATEHAAVHRDSHRIIRVCMAAHQKYDIPLIDAYSAFGIPYHSAGFEYDDKLIADTLEFKKWDASLLDAADDTSYDEAIKTSLKDAVDVVGDDVGVPTIVFTRQDGSKRGYFGPVLDKLPDDNEALAIWDGLSNLATANSFYELKRSRGDVSADTASTARCN